MSRESWLTSVVLIAVLLGIAAWVLIRLVVVPTVDPTPTPSPAALVTVVLATHVAED